MEPKGILSKVRRMALGRAGVSGIRQLCVSLRTLDAQGVGKLSEDHFWAGLKKHGVSLSPQEEGAIAKAFGTPDGAMSVNSFIDALRDSIDGWRRQLVDDAFSSIDKTLSGFVELQKLCDAYNVSSHPEVINGQRKAKDVAFEFSSAFDVQTNPDGKVALGEFREFYVGVSAAIDDDNYFEQLIKAVWSVGSNASNTVQTTFSTTRAVPKRTDNAEAAMTDTGRVYLRQYATVKRPLVFMDISIQGAPPQRVVIELFADSAPKTCKNFQALCTGECGVGLQGKPLWYKGLKFHRIIPGFCIQSGDIVHNNGRGGESIYGKLFDDETFETAFKKPGLVAMANEGPNTNNSQFFFVMKEARYLDDRHVAFGCVIENFDFLKQVEKYGSDNGTPIKEIVIADCGQLQ